MEIGDAVIVNTDSNEVKTEHQDLETLPDVIVSVFLSRRTSVYIAVAMKCCTSFGSVNFCILGKCALNLASPCSVIMCLLLRLGFEPHFLNHNRPHFLELVGEVSKGIQPVKLF